MPTSSRAEYENYFKDHARESGPPADGTICDGQNVSRRAIVRAIRAGARMLRDVPATTRAGHGGRCEELNPKGVGCPADIRWIPAP